MGDLSAHFSAWEFRCKDGTDHAISPELLKCLEKLRTGRSGRPLRVVSGYRSPSWNRKVGGAPNSYHLRGMAADLVKGYATVQHALAAGFRGVGSSDGWAVHVDVRPGATVVFRD